MFLVVVAITADEYKAGAREAKWVVGRESVWAAWPSGCGMGSNPPNPSIHAFLPPPSLSLSLSPSPSLSLADCQCPCARLLTVYSLFPILPSIVIIIILPSKAAGPTALDSKESRWRGRYRGGLYTYSNGCIPTD